MNTTVIICFSRSSAYQKLLTRGQFAPDKGNGHDR
jgi:hypothetical protein